MFNINSLYCQPFVYLYVILSYLLEVKSTTMTVYSPGQQHADGYLGFIKHIILLGLISFLASCIYETDEVYENPVNTHPTPPEIIDLNSNLDVDTFWVYGDYDILYHFQSSNETQRIIGLKVIIDGAVSTTQTSGDGKFSFKQTALEEGVHHMTVEIFAKSGTGSIADKLNGEGFQFSREWVVVADYSSKSVEYTIDNGYLKLSWKPYKNNDLKTYVLQYRTNYNYWRQTTLSVDNPAYIDSLYTGNETSYTITVEKTNGERIPWGSMQVGPFSLEPKLVLSDDYTYYFVWKKSPLRINTKYKLILENTDDFYNTTSVVYLYDTVFMSKLYFGDNYRLSLWAIPGAETDESSYPSSRLMGITGIPVKMLDNTTFTSPDSLTAFDNRYVYNYSMDGLHETVMSILPGYDVDPFWMQASPRGRFLIGMQYDVIDTKDTRYFAKNLTTGEVYHMDSGDSVQFSRTYGYSGIISDNGLCLFQSSSKEFLYDFPNNVVLASRSFKQAEYFSSAFQMRENYFTKISPDGRYYFSYMRNHLKGPTTLILYKRNGSNLEKLIDLDAKTTYWNFNPIKPDNYVIVKDNQLSVYQCEPHLLLYSVTFSTDEHFNNIDYFAREILSVTNTQFIIRDLISGNEIKRLPKRPDKSRWYSLHNHRIICDKHILKTQ